jgi:hypothetical protein
MKNVGYWIIVWEPWYADVGALWHILVFCTAHTRFWYLIHHCLSLIIYRESYGVYFSKMGSRDRYWQYRAAATRGRRVCHLFCSSSHTNSPFTSWFIHTGTTLAASRAAAHPPSIMIHYWNLQETRWWQQKGEKLCCFVIQNVLNDILLSYTFCCFAGPGQCCKMIGIWRWAQGVVLLVAGFWH